MHSDLETFRLLRAVMRFVDRHAERKDGPGVLQVPMLAREMQELRSALEPFRPTYRRLESLSRRRVEEICDGAPPTPDEIDIRDFLGRGRTPG